MIHMTNTCPAHKNCSINAVIKSTAITTTFSFNVNPCLRPRQTPNACNKHIIAFKTFSRRPQPTHEKKKGGKTSALGKAPSDFLETVDEIKNGR